MDLINSYKTFLDNGKTERECVTTALAMAQAKGFRPIGDYKELKAGDRVYVTNHEKSVALFVIGQEDIRGGINFVTSHIDSPRLDLKMKPVYEKDGVVYLNTHYYGGIKKYQWVTMPLAIHGVIFRKDGSRVDVIAGEKEDEPSFCISDILPHMAQEQMKKSASDFIEGEDLDLVVGLDPKGKDGKEEGKAAILSIIEKEWGIKEDDFLSAELEVVPAGRARSLGFDSSLVMAYGQDDRVCAYTSLQAILDLEGMPKRTACTLLVDKEEIGSTGMSGMDSQLLSNLVAEVLDKCGCYSSLALRRCLRDSKMLSSDVTAAFDPLAPRALRPEQRRLPWQGSLLREVHRQPWKVWLERREPRVHRPPEEDFRRGRLPLADERDEQGRRRRRRNDREVRGLVWHGRHRLRRARAEHAQPLGDHSPERHRERIQRLRRLLQSLRKSPIKQGRPATGPSFVSSHVEEHLAVCRIGPLAPVHDELELIGALSDLVHLAED